MRLFKCDTENGISGGITGSIFSDEKGDWMWSPWVKDLNEKKISLEGTFPTVGNYPPINLDCEDFSSLDQVKGKGALVLVKLRSLNHGQVCRPDFSCQEKNLISKVDSTVDGLPLAELWIFEEGEHFLLRQRMVLVLDDALWCEGFELGINGYSV